MTSLEEGKCEKCNCSTAYRWNNLGDYLCYDCLLKEVVDDEDSIEEESEEDEDLYDDPFYDED